MNQILEKIDQFGAEYKPSIGKEKEHRSLQGGIFTLLVYGASFAYFLFVIQQWYSGQILPKTMTQTQASDFQIYEIPKDFIEVSFVRYDDNLTDPFREQGNILMPIALILQNDIPISQTSLLASSDSVSMYGTNMIEMDNIKIVKNSANNKSEEKDQFFSLIITTCKEKYLTGNQTCAPKDEISNFFSNHALITLQFEVLLQQFDQKKNCMTTFKKQLQFILQQNSIVKTSLMFQNAHTTVDDQLLFSNSREFEYFQDFEVVTQTLSSSMTMSLINDESLLQMVLKVDPIEIVSQVTYIKLGEMLADVGSISSLLLTLSWFIQQFNKEQLENHIIDEIISIYYPEFKKLNKKKNFMGKTVEIFRDQHQINKEAFQNWYNQTRNKIRSKISITNQIYEVSKIYFFLRSQFNQEWLNLTDDIGVRIPSHIFIKTSVEDINNELQTPQLREMKVCDIGSCNLKKEYDLNENDIFFIIPHKEN